MAEEKTDQIPHDISPVIASEDREHPDFQAIFERLLRGYKSGEGKEVKFSSEPIQGLDGGVIQQELFVSPKFSGEIPHVGARLTSDRGQAEYRATFFEGQPSAYGKVWVGEFHLEMKALGKGVSAPGEKFGVKGQELSDMYDVAVVQAVVNVYERKILHSVEVDYGSFPRKTKLLKQGYSERQGYPQVLDKFYDPQS